MGLAERKLAIRGKLHAPDNKMVIKSHPAPRLRAEGMFMVEGVPQHRCSCFPGWEVFQAYRAAGVMDSVASC